MPTVLRSALVKKMRHWLRSLLGPYPLFVHFLRWRHNGVNGIFGPDTEIVIESYPRSGNTFCVTALEMAHGRQLRRADHLHAPAQVILAARTHTPCLVLVRRPMDAILSHALRFPHISIKQCLTDYVRFYETVAPLRGHYVLARFESATRDFGAVVRALNSKFDAHFIEFEHTPENEAKCFELVQQRYENRYGGGRPISEAVHSRPSMEKSRIKQAGRQAFVDAFEAPKLAGLRERANNIYEELAAKADL